MTATATPTVAADICRQLEVLSQCVVRVDYQRPTRQLHFTPNAADQRDALLIERLRQRPPGAAIIYVTLPKTADQLARHIGGQGLEAKVYHEDMSSEEREVVRTWFRSARRGIVITTSALGVNIDHPNVRYVYHYNPPPSLEDYYREIGPAGRNGEPSLTELLLCPDDVNLLENAVYGDSPDRHSIVALVQHILKQKDSFGVSYFDLSHELDLRQSMIRVLLALLESLGIVEGGEPYYQQYKFHPLLSSAAILARFEGPRRSLLADLFRQARRAQKWFHLDLDAAARRLNTPRQQLVRALDYLAEQQWLEVQASGLRYRYRLVQRPATAEQLIDQLWHLMRERESRELERLQQVQDLVYHPGCQTRRLANYFDDTAGESTTAVDCGQCSFCLSEGSAPPRLARPSVELPPDLWATLAVVQRRHAWVFDHPRVLAKFLCGIPSPQLIRGRVSSHPLFGLLAQAPFAAVLELCQQRLHPA
jgi:ATP-dependent DNA helicase RecQ